MTILATFAARAPRLMGIVAPDYFPPCLLDSVAISGPAQITKPTQRPDGGVQLLIQRETLLAQAKRARNLRQSKLASLIEAEMRVLNLEILWQGRAT